MTTWQGFSGPTGAVVTTWNHDSQRGFLTSKEYNDDNGPTYTYTDVGRLLTRVWDRNVTTTKTHDRLTRLLSTASAASVPATA